MTYHGAEETWAHRIFRRDIPLKGGSSIIDDTIELLRRRSDATEGGGGRRKVTDMMRRGVMTFMERVVLADKAKRHGAWATEIRSHTSFLPGPASPN